MECVFGTLKQRWRILKPGIRIHSLELANNFFKTCYALHNFLLDANGMDIPWEGVFKCDYDSKDSEDHVLSDVPASVHDLCRKHGSFLLCGFVLKAYTY